MRKLMLAAALAAALPTASFAQSVEEGRSQAGGPFSFFGTTEGVIVGFGALGLFIAGIVVIATNNRGRGQNGNGNFIFLSGT